MENGKYHLEAMKKAKELKDLMVEADSLKEQMKDMWDSELQKIKDYHGVKFDSVLGDIRRLDAEISNLNSSYKVYYLFIYIIS